MSAALRIPLLLRSGGLCSSCCRTQVRQAAGRKYSTMPAPIEASSSPAYHMSPGGALGGCMIIEYTTLIVVAPPNTSGITYRADPPLRNAQMMQTAPTAPRMPPIVAAMAPPVLKLDRPPCADNAATGTMTPTRKYAAPTQRSAFSGLPSCIWPSASIDP